MNLDVTQGDGYSVIRCTGLVDESTRGDFDKFVHPILEEKSSRVLVDLAAVPRITSEGINVLVTLVARANTKGSRVVFVRPTAFVKTVFDTTKINQFLETESSWDAGVTRLLRDSVATDAATSCDSL